MRWLRRFIAQNPAKVFREGPEPITMGIKEHDMSWAVSVFENGKLYQRIQYKDKNKALNEFHRQGAKYGGSKCHEVELKEISNG